MCLHLVQELYRIYVGTSITKLQVHTQSRQTYVTNFLRGQQIPCILTKSEVGIRPATFSALQRYYKMFQFFF